MSDERLKHETATFGRRDFLKTGALGAGAAVTLTGCGGRDEDLIPLLIPEDTILPGVERWTASTCALCAAGCGIRVRSMLGEARVRQNGEERRQMVLQVKNIEGNPAHPVNRGKLCARGEAGPQMLYNPDRIRTPLRRTGPRGSGQYEAITWDEALSQARRALTGAGAKLAALCGGSSRSRQELVRRVLAGLGSERCYFDAPPGVAVLCEANRRLFGRAELELHDIENARYLISFGANILESHTSPVRYNLGLGHFRQGNPGRRGKFVQVEGRFSLSAANADEWLPARPGTEGDVALALAHTICKEELYDKDFARAHIRGFDAFRAFVSERYAPEKIAEALDVPSKKLVRVAREFARHQPGLALAGGSALAHPHGVFTAAAVQSLNALAGNIGRPGGISWNASAAPAPARVLGARAWTEDLVSAADSIQVLILWDADPVYGSPAAMELRKALGKIPFIVAFSAFMDDSTAEADLVLPDQTYLERWDLVEPAVTRGQRILSITQPIVKSLYESRDRAEVLMALAGLPLDGGFSGYLKGRLAESKVLGHGSFAADDVDAFWSTLLDKGVWVDDAAAAPAPAVDLALVPELAPRASADVDAADYPLLFVPFYSGGLGDGRAANLPWLQELPDSMTSVVWGSWAELNPRTAAELQISDGEIVILASPAGRIRVPALLQPAARPDTVSIPFGQGHRLYGRYAAGRGANPWEVLAPRFVRGTAEPAWAATRVRVVKSGEKARVVRIGWDRERGPAEIHR
ncbi:MAG: nitrate reductase [Acidobacteria bacterium]|nr:MAG: nitrate reductase [Acidobacteriota bacterium]